MAIVVKDANNSDNSLKTTYDAVNSWHTPHHYLDGTSAVSGSLFIASGLVGATGTVAVSGSFPSGVQYTEGATPGADSIIGRAVLGEKPDGSLGTLQQNTSGYAFVLPRHPHSEPHRMFNALQTVSSTVAAETKAAPSPTSNRYYITSFSASNTSATGAIFSMWSDSTNIFNAYVAESGGGIAMTLPTPIVCGTGEAIKSSLSLNTESILLTVQGYMDV